MLSNVENMSLSMQGAVVNKYNLVTAISIVSRMGTFVNRDTTSNLENTCERLKFCCRTSKNFICVTNCIGVRSDWCSK